MKTLFMIALTLALVLLFIRSESSPWRIVRKDKELQVIQKTSLEKDKESTASASSAASAVQQASPTSQQHSKPSRLLPQCVVKMAEKNGIPADARVESIYRQGLSSMTLWHFRARIVEHLNDQRLLVELIDWKERDFPKSQYFVVLNHPGFDQAIDRDIISVQGYTVGPYTYQSIDGGSRAIMEVDCADDSHQAIDPSKSGSWMWDKNRRTSLDSPRRGY